MSRQKLLNTANVSFHSDKMRVLFLYLSFYCLHFSVSCRSSAPSNRFKFWPISCCCRAEVTNQSCRELKTLIHCCNRVVAMVTETKLELTFLGWVVLLLCLLQTAVVNSRRGKIFPQCTGLFSYWMNLNVYIYTVSVYFHLCSFTVKDDSDECNWRKHTLNTLNLYKFNKVDINRQKLHSLSTINNSK